MINPLVQNHALVSAIAEDVLVGLSGEKKSLPPRLFYDAEGSQLFEQITELPEYYLTRTERRILQDYAQQMLQGAGEGLTLIELGAGTASKTRVIIAALLKRQLRATFYPIDVSESALQVAEQNLTSEFPGLRLRPLVGDFSSGLAQLAKVGGRKLVLYIGSSIGNYEPGQGGELLCNVRKALQPGDALLLGTDMVKDALLLHAAYNDSEGVTAKFNLNILARVNRELRANFDLNSFAHVAYWNPKESRMEIYIESLRQQEVWIADLGMRVSFRKGERIHTENSYKFTLKMVDSILKTGGFSREQTWTDDKGWFGVHLARV